MMRLAALSGILVAAFTAGAAAKDPGDGAYLIRMLACEGEDARWSCTSHNRLRSERRRQRKPWRSP